MSHRIENIIKDENTGFLGIIFFILLALYMFYATFVGNVKFGLRFFSLNFYPMVPKETFVNSFIANAMIMNIWMHAFIFELVDLFRWMFTGTQAAIFF